MVKRYKGKEKGRIHTEVRVDAKRFKGKMAGENCRRISILNSYAGCLA